MKQKLAAILTAVMLVCIMIPQAMAATVYTVTVSLTDGTKTVEATSGSGSASTKLAAEVVQLLGGKYDELANTFAGSGLKDIVDAGQTAFNDDAAWAAYVGQYTGLVSGSFKDQLADKNTTYGDVTADQANQLTYKATNGETYTLTVTVNKTSTGGGSGSGGSSSSATYPVNTPSKTANGTVTVSPKNAAKGATVTITVKPESGYQLDTITVTDKDGDTLKLTSKGNDQYTFTMPAGKVDVKATFSAEEKTSPFTDVSTSAYYYDAVKWAAEQGITGGTGDGKFGPNASCTRAQIVTFLWRAAGSPEPKNASTFSDVAGDAYYAKAVAWAIENGITLGTTETTFSPDATCTRAQSMTFLYRAVKESASGAPAFSDVASDAYYAAAVKWATDNGITNGIGGGLFGSDNACTRAQIVTFLYRAYQGK